MDKTFIILEPKQTSTNLDKSVIELQKTIIYYGEQIIKKLDIIMSKEEDKKKDFENLKIKEPPKHEDYLIQHLLKMKLPKDKK